MTRQPGAVAIHDVADPHASQNLRTFAQRRPSAADRHHCRAPTHRRQDLHAAASRQAGTHDPATLTGTLTDREALADWLHQARPGGPKPTLTDLDVELADLTSRE